MWDTDVEQERFRRMGDGHGDESGALCEISGVSADAAIDRVRNAHDGTFGRESARGRCTGNGWSRHVVDCDSQEEGGDAPQSCLLPPPLCFFGGKEPPCMPSSPGMNFMNFTALSHCGKRARDSGRHPARRSER